MFKKQLTIQKIVSMIALFASVLTIIFSLGFMTDVFRIIPPIAYDQQLAADPNYKGTFEGAILFHEFQPINKRLIVLSIIVLLLTLLIYITLTNSRRKYYISNYIVSIGVPVANIGIAIYALTQIAICKTRFLTEVDFDGPRGLQYYAKIRPDTYTYSKSTLWFDLATVAYVILIVAALLVLANLIFKIIVMKKEQQLLQAKPEEVQS